MKQIIVVRTDVNMRKGKMCSQSAHASLKATLENLETPQVKEWLSGSFTKIVVGAESLEKLLEVVENAKSKSIITALITDNGKTEFHGVPTITCAAIGPATAEELESVTGELKLL